MPQPLDVNRIEGHLLERARTKPRTTTAIVHPCSRGALLAAIEAAREGLIEPVLVGPQSKIQAIAMEQELDISAYRLVDVPHSHAAAVKAVQMAASSEVQALMKGSIHTDELMSEAVRHDGGHSSRRG